MWPARTLSTHVRIPRPGARLSDAERYSVQREQRAEERARELLRSCVNPEEWAMYDELGFIRVWGGAGGATGRAREGQARYAYLIYPHKPIVAYVRDPLRILSEYCVRFPDAERPYGSERLPASDDVLAKWLALSGDEQQIISIATVRVTGGQIDPLRVTDDLVRLAAWETRRLGGTERAPGSVPAS